MQTKLMSLIEASLNVTIGYLCAVVTQMIVFPLFGIYLPLHSNFTLALVFTLISLVRNYIIRRWFDRKWR